MSRGEVSPSGSHSNKWQSQTLTQVNTKDVILATIPKIYITLRILRNHVTPLPVSSSLALGMAGIGHWSGPVSKQLEGEIQGRGRLGQHPQRDDIDVWPTEPREVAQRDTPTGLHTHARELGLQCFSRGVQLLQDTSQGEMRTPNLAPSQEADPPHLWPKVVQQDEVCSCLCRL